MTEKDIMSLDDTSELKQQYLALTDTSLPDSILYANITEDVKAEISDFVGRAAKEIFFRNDNAYGRAMRKFQENHPILGIFTSTIDPFARMSYNMMMTAMRFSPFGFVKLLKDKHYFKKLSEEIAKSKDLGEKFINEIEKARNAYKELNYSSEEQFKLRYEELNAKQENRTKEESEEYEKLSEIYANLKEAKYNKDAIQYKLDKAFNSLKGFEQYNLTKTLSDATIGTSLFMLGLIMYFTGALEIDDEDYMNVVLNIAGVKLRISDLNPLASSFAGGALLANVFNEGFSEESMVQLTNGILENTILSFMTDATEFSDSFGEYFMNIASNLVTQYIPNFIKQFGKIFSQRKMQKSSDIFRRWYENIVDAIPGLRDLLLQPKVDPYTGGPVKRYDLPSWAIGLAELVSFMGLPIK